MKIELIGNVIIAVLVLFTLWLYCGAIFVTPRIFRDGPPEELQDSNKRQEAEDGATAYELVSWFDWDRTDTALVYIRRGGAMTERLSRRKW